MHKKDKALQFLQREQIWILHIARIFLLFVVVVNHYLQKIGNPVGGFFGIRDIYYVSLGGVAVTFFIFISGLLLSRRSNESLWQFYLRRLASIYRVYWASIPVCAATMMLFMPILKKSDLVVENVRSIWDILIFLSGFMAYFGKWAESTNSPAWFIGTIISLYVLYPVVFEIVRRYKLYGLVLLFVISISARYFFTKWSFLPTRPMDWMPLSRVFEFGIGIYAKPQMDTIKGFEMWVSKYFASKKLAFVSKIFARIILLLSTLSFPLFLVHYPMLNIVDYFRTTNAGIFALYLSSSIFLAFLCYFLSKIGLRSLFAIVILTLTLIYIYNSAYYGESLKSFSLPEVKIGGRSLFIDFSEIKYS